MPLMSLREYARHRGCSLAAVQKAIDDGRIQIAKEEPHGNKIWKFVDSHIADQEWQNNTDPTQQRIATRKEKGIIDAPAARSPTYKTNSNQTELFPDTQAPASQSKNAASPHGELYSKARSVKETWEAKTAEAEYKKLIGKLVDIDLLKSRLFNISSEIRTNAANIGPQVSSIIRARVHAFILELKENPDATFDEKEIEDIINGEIDSVFERIANGDFGF